MVQPDAMEIAAVRALLEQPAPAKPNGKPEPLIRSISEVLPVREYAAHPIQWVWHGLVAEQAVTIWTGDAGSGKSTLAAALAWAVASGAPLLGRETTRRPVLYLDRENPLPVVVERFERLGIQDGEAPLRVWGGWLPEEPPAPASPIVMTWVKECDPRPLIVADSLIAFHTGNENDAAETRQFLAGFRLLTNLGATVLALHHSGKADSAKDYRGSSDIKASVDAAYHLANLGDPARLEMLRLRAFKTRFAAEVELVFRYAGGRFQADERGPALTVPELLRDLLKANPGVRSADFENLAAEKGLGRDRARTFLLNSVRGGTVRVDRGDHNTKFHTWVGGSEDGLF